MSAEDEHDVRIRPLAADDVEALLDLRRRNRGFLAPWEPLRDESFYTRAAQSRVLAEAARAREEGRTYAFGVLVDGALAGGVTLSDVVRGVFESCHLGYWVDERHGGRGVATAAVRSTVDFAFGEAGLHRVQAAVMPRNAPSLRVLAKLGFREEGLALRYLRIAGAWEDHRLLAVTREEWRTPG